jgi:hypothetical protein
LRNYPGSDECLDSTSYACRVVHSALACAEEIHVETFTHTLRTVGSLSPSSATSSDFESYHHACLNVCTELVHSVVAVPASLDYLPTPSRRSTAPTLYVIDCVVLAGFYRQHIYGTSPRHAPDLSFESTALYVIDSRASCVFSNVQLSTFARS